MTQKLDRTAPPDSSDEAPSGWSDLVPGSIPYTSVAARGVDFADGLSDVSPLPPEGITHLELVRVIERIHRRYCDLLRVELLRLGIDDISPPQVMLLFTIGEDELSVRDLLERGHYIGSNASYNLKQLVDAGYIHRTASARDKRSARIRLDVKGRHLCEQIRGLDEVYHRLVARDAEEERQMSVAYGTLRRMELAWTNAMRYGDA